MLQANGHYPLQLITGYLCNRPQLPEVEGKCTFRSSADKRCGTCRLPIFALLDLPLEIRSTSSSVHLPLGDIQHHALDSVTKIDTHTVEELRALQELSLKTFEEK
jgi:hypothetical protein